MGMQVHKGLRLVYKDHDEKLYLFGDQAKQLLSPKKNGTESFKFPVESISSFHLPKNSV